MLFLDHLWDMITTKKWQFTSPQKQLILQKLLYKKNKFLIIASNNLKLTKNKIPHEQ